MNLIKEKEWVSKRNYMYLGLRSIIQGIDQLRKIDVLIDEEKHQLSITQIQINELIQFFQDRNKISREKYCG